MPSWSATGKYLIPCIQWQLGFVQLGFVQLYVLPWVHRACCHERLMAADDHSIICCCWRVGKYGIAITNNPTFSTAYAQPCSCIIEKMEGCVYFFFSWLFPSAWEAAAIIMVTT